MLLLSCWSLTKILKTYIFSLPIFGSLVGSSCFVYVIWKVTLQRKNSHKRWSNFLGDFAEYIAKNDDSVMTHIICIFTSCCFFFIFLLVHKEVQLFLLYPPVKQLIYSLHLCFLLPVLTNIIHSMHHEVGHHQCWQLPFSPLLPSLF